MLARALDAWWAELGEPDPFTVIDWGAGPGTLARAVLAAAPRCMSAGALRLVLVEVSPAQRAQHPVHPLVTSAASVGAALPNGAAAGVVVANELLDNLPFDIVQCTEDGWQELLVCLSSGSSKGEAEPQGAGLQGAGLQDSRPGDGFALRARPAASGLVEGLPDVPVGARVSVQQAARRWVAEAHRVLREGWIVAFDYGADTAELALRSVPTDDCRPAGGQLAESRAAITTPVGDLASGLGWLRTYRNHDRGTSWIQDPGSCDVSADVATDQAQADHRAEVCTQAEFLLAHGIDELVSEGREVWAERAGAGDLKALAARSRAREAEALLDSDGMGGFKALLWRVG